MNESNPPASQANQENQSINLDEGLDVELRCASCNYILRGLPDTQNCPECGFKISTSIELQQRASARKLFIILLRFFAFLILIEPLVTRFGFIHQGVLYYLSTQETRYDAPDHWMEFTAPIVAIFAFAAVIWFIAPVIAKFAAPIDTPVIINLGGLRNGLILVAFAFGMWLVASSIDSLSEIAVRSFNRGGDTFSGEYARTILGIGLFRLMAGFTLILFIIRYHKRMYESSK